MSQLCVLIGDSKSDIIRDRNNETTSETILTCATCKTGQEGIPEERRSNKDDDGPNSFMANIDQVSVKLYEALDNTTGDWTLCHFPNKSGPFAISRHFQMPTT